MKPLSVKKLLEFRMKPNDRKKGFVKDLTKSIDKEFPESGGNYWISALSAISRSFQYNEIQPLTEKRIELEEKRNNAEFDRTKIMYKRNINILSSYEDIDTSEWRPSEKLVFLKKNLLPSPIMIKGLGIRAVPNHVFKFNGTKNEEVGSIWFIAKLGGYKNDELGMYAEVSHRLLKLSLAKEFQINARYCLAVDVYSNLVVSYEQIQKGEVRSTLIQTVDEIMRFL